MKYHTPFHPDKIYHIFNHAVGDENLFREPTNYQHFLNLIGKYIYPISHILCYNLLPNHFHILLKIRTLEELNSRHLKLYGEEKNRGYDNWPKFISQQLSNCFNAYAKAYNKRYERKGALFIDYVKRTEVTDMQYLKNLIHYIHYNAAHHGLCEKTDDWFWSSYMAMTSAKESRVDKEMVFKSFEGKEVFVRFHNGVPDISGDDLEFM